MDVLLKKAFNAEQFRNMGHEMVDMLANHLEGIAHVPKVNTTFLPPEDRRKEWEAHFREVRDEPMDLFRKILPDLVHLHHPHFMGHQVGAAAPISALSEFFAGLLNNGTAVYEMAAPIAAMEDLVCRYTANLFGYDQGGGVLTSGGSLGNLTAILAAKQIKAGGLKNPCIMVSSESHYCISRAANITGLGETGIVSVPILQDRSMNAALLEVTYQKALAEGKEVFAIVANACSTATGTYDDLEAIGRFAQQHDLWFHVDGAHGSAAILSETHKYRLKGVELADSLVVDYHKMWLCASPATAVLFKNAHDSYQTFRQKASYLWEKDQEEEWYNMGRRTLECTKYMMAVKVYATLKYLGGETIGSYVDQTQKVAQLLYQKLEDDPDFQVFMKPQSNIVCFRYNKGENLNKMNAELRKRLLREGRFYIVQTLIDDELYLRTALMSPFTEASHLDSLLQDLKRRL